ncbi:MAG: hypothetical protein M1812_005370 [Candelaria pacifica]|nr:MAG: hypothetical protein M1812_005370 [Candelaria pacifica]
MSIPSFTDTYHHKSYAAISPLNPHLSLSGKNVLITGGGGGIGRALTTAFALAGASNIIITGRNTSPLEASRKAALEAKSAQQKDTNTQIHIFSADITDQAGIPQLFKTIEQTIGNIDVLINNAGYLQSPSLSVDMDIDDSWLGFEINVKGTMIMSKAFLKHITANKVKEPIYINVTSAAALFTFPSGGAYAAGKAAATRIMDHVQLNHPELRVFNLQPGIVETEMSKKSGFSMKDSDDVDLPAHFMVWLTSPEAAFLKGRFLFANWDVEEMKAKKKELENDPTLLTVTLGGWPFAGKT